MIVTVIGITAGVLFWPVLGAWMFWPSLQNARDTAFAGRGSRHRETGVATPWHHSRPQAETDPRFRADGSRRRLWRPVNAPIAAVEMREWTSTVQTPSPLDRIRAIDLSGLARLAGGPL